MTIIQACVLGFFQGVAEFLPISSSGHLLLFKDIMGLTEVPALFDVVLHLATLASILVVFRKRVAGIIASMARWAVRRHGEADAENLALVPPAVIATLLTAIIGFGLDRIDFSGAPRLVAGFFLATAAMLVFASTRRPGTASYKTMGLRTGIIVGIAQGIGVLPGISRSGITISAGLASGLERGVAGELSFLLAIPAILGAFILKVGDAMALAGTVPPLALASGSVVAFVTGVAALLLLMPLVRKGRLGWFAVYLVPAGILGLFLL